MSNKCFEGTDSEVDADESPITPTDLNKHFQQGDLLHWWYLAPGYGYDPYLVRFISQNGTTLRFNFIDCETAKDVGQQHIVSTSDTELLFPGIPTTLPTSSDYSAGRTIGFLMLNPRVLARAGLTTDATAANTGSLTASGKWPGTAAEPYRYYALQKQLRQLREENARYRERDAALSHLLDQVRDTPGLPPDVRSRISHILGGP
ncbi:MAG TPA: hypothetical protein VHE35_27700 [Kofleriaceae bacterium]|nr:hypothetical protein [Kofleriaceae bacterium]